MDGAVLPLSLWQADGRYDRPSQWFRISTRILLCSVETPISRFNSRVQQKEPRFFNDLSFSFQFKCTQNTPDPLPLNPNFEAINHRSSINLEWNSRLKILCPVLSCGTLQQLLSAMSKTQLLCTVRTLFSCSTVVNAASLAK